MIVIADTTPINYLILIGEIEILEKLYGQILIPNAVFEELKAETAPPEIKIWIENQPKWFQVGRISNDIAEDLKILDAGEAEAIQLANELKANLLVIDERLGRRKAAECGLRIIETIGILALAKERDLINIEDVIENLERTNFYLSDDLKNCFENRNRKIIFPDRICKNRAGN